MPITDKLNSIITKLSDGATKPTGQTIEEKLDIIDSLIDAGGSSGGGTLYINGTYDDNLEIHLGKSYAELLDAFKAGKFIALCLGDTNTLSVDTEGGMQIAILCGLSHYDGYGYSAGFVDPSTSDGPINFVADTSTEEMVTNSNVN